MFFKRSCRLPCGELIRQRSGEMGGGEVNGNKKSSSSALVIIRNWKRSIFSEPCTPITVLVVKNPPSNAGDIRDTGSIPGSRRSPGGEHGNPLQFLACRNPWTEEPGRLQSMGSQRVWHNWSNSTQHRRWTEHWTSHQKTSMIWRTTTYDSLGIRKMTCLCVSYLV